MIIDLFAGGGGASTGIEMALGRSPTVAINHNNDALALHAANHPDTLHLISDILEVSPLDVTRGAPVGLLWASPDCKHFSRAKGSAPLDKKVRGLAWVVPEWAEQTRPDVICLENVEEFLTWGPLDAEGQAIKEQAGETFQEWKSKLESLGYNVEYRVLRASDYGAPTIRRRLFVVARCDGKPIVWPEPTHGEGLLPMRSAAECIDWSIPCPSIFDSKAEIQEHLGLRAQRPLADNTMARIARGMKRYVLDAPQPFLLSLKGTARRDSNLEDPHPTILAGGSHSALIAPILTYAQHGGVVRDIRDPVHTIAASSKDQNGVIAAFLAQHNTGLIGHDARDPLSTISATGSHQTPVAAFFAKYYGKSEGVAVDEPMHTITVKDRFCHVQAEFGDRHLPRAKEVADFLRRYGAWDGGDIVTLGGLAVIDIGMRMLTPRELFNAQGFPPSYQIGQFSKKVQISCCGNSVCPDLARAIVGANCQHLILEEKAA